VQAVAQALGIELRFWPASSPNLKLIERFWRFVQQAILTCMQQAPTPHQEELHRLLTLRFQTFQEVTVMGEQQTASQGSKKKVLSKAA
jgi:hypothetical protein